MLNLIKTLTVACFAIQYVYWLISAITTERTKPRNKENFSLIAFVRAGILPVILIFVIFQMVGGSKLRILHAPIVLPLVGLLTTIIGLAICIIARKTLGDNWTNAYEYQIKKHHELITNGIYSVIRHPIYLGLTLMLIGGEMVAESYLFISFFAFFIVFYIQGKREEKILLSHFGKKYEDYMKRTKMLIPFVI